MSVKVSVCGWVLVGLLPTACSTTPPPSNPVGAITGAQTVHCLLPPRVQKIGNLVYPARRELVFETETRCSLRGGEYTVYDRASAASSAAFYRQQAEEGDADAQYSLGLVYESLFSPAAYDEAARWYEQAAAQNHVSAQKNLAFLYEQGLGVRKDPLKAVNLLRLAGGIDDELVLTSELDAARSEAETEIRRLTAAVEKQNGETAGLQASLAAANRSIVERKAELDRSRHQLASMVDEIDALKQRTASGRSAPSDEKLLESLSQLQAEASSNERVIADQEVSIASLEADVTAQRAQLAASEQKAKLRAQRLTEQLARAESESVESLRSVLIDNQSKDRQIDTLSADLTNVRLALREQQAQYEGLTSQLAGSRARVQQGEQASTEVTRLLDELTDRERTIGEQRQRIDALQQQAARASEDGEKATALNAEVSTLREQLSMEQANYQDVQARLEANQERVAQGQAASGEVARLERELADQSEIIGRQTQQIEALQAEAERSGQALAVVTDEQRQKVSELDMAHARLVAAETELVGVRTALTDLHGRLSREQLVIAELEQEKTLLERALRSSSRSSDEFQELSARLTDHTSELRQKDAQIVMLNQEIASMEAELTNAATERSQKLAMRNVPKPVFPAAPEMDLPPGERYALIIGNDRYDNFQDLTTAEIGAKTVSDVLTNRYGFKTTLLTNAKRRDIMLAFAQLQRQLKSNDYVLIYYAGHGQLDASDEQVTYWLPVDAGSADVHLAADGIKSTWITNEVRAMKARHVMIIADSCYAGAMVRPPRIAVSRTDIDRRRLQYMVRGRSRTVLSSGGNSPVLDESLQGPHSVFTKALVEVLERNSGIIYGEALHAALVELVRFNAEQLDFTQEPLFSEIADAGHLNGQFVLKTTI